MHGPVGGEEIGALTASLSPSDGAEDEEVLIKVDAIGFGRFQYVLFALCGLGFMADATEIYLIGFLFKSLQDEWGLTQFQTDNVGTVVFVGELVGSFFWGPFADRFGRRLGFFFPSLLIFGFGVGTFFVRNYTQMLIVRGLVGFGSAGFTVAFDLLCEVLPTYNRGKYLMAIEFFWTAGAVYIVVMAWLFLDSMGWRFLVLSACVPSGICLMCFPLIPESPRWLLTQEGRRDDAVAVLERAARKNGFDLVIPPNAVPPRNVEESVPVWAILSGPIRRTTLLLWVVWLCFGFCFYGAVFYASAAIPAPPGSSHNFRAMLIGAMFEAVGVFVMILVIDRAGRKPSQVASYILTGMACCGMALVAHLSVTYPLVLFFALTRMATMASSSATWVITPELYPTEMRTTGDGYCSAAGRIGAILATHWANANLPSLRTLRSDQMIVLAYAIAAFVSALACAFLPETTGTDLSLVGGQAHGGQESAGDEDTDEDLIMGQEVLMLGRHTASKSEDVSDAG